MRKKSENLVRFSSRWKTDSFVIIRPIIEICRWIWKMRIRRIGRSRLTETISIFNLKETLKFEEKKSFSSFFLTPFKSLLLFEFICEDEQSYLIVIVRNKKTRDNILVLLKRSDELEKRKRKRNRGRWENRRVFLVFFIFVFVFVFGHKSRNETKNHSFVYILMAAAEWIPHSCNSCFHLEPIQVEKSVQTEVFFLFLLKHFRIMTNSN